ncbi:MAG: VanZ family protein [Chloroflexota bacterium]|nr:VanZ family protein [Chloroflexota bacterium]
MRLFSSARERQLWLWSAAVVVAIYATLGLAGTLAEVLREYELLDASSLLLFAMFLLGATILTSGIRLRPRGAEIAVLLGITFVYLLLFLRTTVGPAERTHLMEYGVLGVFIHEALVERVSQGRRVPVPPVVAVVLTTLLGVADEGIQWLLPNRVFDPVDILFNFLAGTTSVAAVVVLAWARRWGAGRRGPPGTPDV